MTITDASTETFEAEVLAASHAQPVLVDFWAPWCGPCRALTPALETAVRERGGAIKLVKINVDENQAIAARFDVRSIPNVKAFADGALVDEFTGALPLAGVRRFIDRVLPGPAERARREAAALLAQGDFDAAEARLREALALDGALAAVRLDLAALLATRDRCDEIEALLEPIAEHERDDRFAALAARVASWRAARELPPLDELAARVARAPDDLATRLALAERLVADAQYARALETLLEVAQRARAPAERALREDARKTMLRVFTLAATDTELVGRFRRELAAVLN